MITREEFNRRNKER